MSLKAERSEELTKLLGTRNVYGEVLAELGETHKNIVVLNIVRPCEELVVRLQRLLLDSFHSLEEY